jgi:hypothetical protein
MNCTKQQLELQFPVRQSGSWTSCCSPYHSAEPEDSIFLGYNVASLDSPDRTFSENVTTTFSWTFRPLNLRALQTKNHEMVSTAVSACLARCGRLLAIGRNTEFLLVGTITICTIPERLDSSDITSSVQWTRLGTNAFTMGSSDLLFAMKSCTCASVTFLAGVSSLSVDSTLPRNFGINLPIDAESYTRKKEWLDISLWNSLKIGMKCLSHLPYTFSFLISFFISSVLSLRT